MAPIGQSSIPQFMRSRLETVARAFERDRKATVGFHVLNEGGFWTVTAYQYPDLKEASVDVMMVLKAFDHWQAGDLFAAMWMSNNGTPLMVSGEMNGVEVEVSILRQYDGPHPPLLFDLFTQQWTEREASEDDVNHGVIK